MRVFQTSLTDPMVAAFCTPACQSPQPFNCPLRHQSRVPTKMEPGPWDLSRVSWPSSPLNEKSKAIARSSLRLRLSAVAVDDLKVPLVDCDPKAPLPTSGKERRVRSKALCLNANTREIN